MNQSLKTYQELSLKKHINAIHCTNNLTLIQRKLFNALLFNAYPDLPYKSDFQISAKELCQLIGYNSNDYNKIKKGLMALMTVAIEWNVIDHTVDSNSSWQASTALSCAKLENGICTYEYSSLMRELLYRPEIYGRLDMTILTKFKSSYGLALYENCIRYQGLSKTPWFPIEVFKKLMGVFNNKYRSFNDLKKRVLNISVEEVNSHSPLFITPEVKRQNQKVIAIRFLLTTKNEDVLGISSRNEANSNHTQMDSKNDDLMDFLGNNFGLSPESIKELLIKYDYAYIKEKADIIMKSESYRLGKIRALAGYLIDAIKKDYKINKSSNNVTQEIKYRKKEVEEQERIKQAKLEELHKLYKQYVSLNVDKYMDQFEPVTKQAIFNQFEDFLNRNHQPVIGWYLKHGIQHPAIRGLFNTFIKQLAPEFFTSLLEFEDFQKNLLSKKEGI